MSPGDMRKEVGDTPTALALGVGSQGEAVPGWARKCQKSNSPPESERISGWELPCGADKDPQS